MKPFGPHACVETWHDAPALLVEGRPLPPMWYTEFPYDHDAYLRALGEAGIRVFFIPHQLPWYDPAGNERLRKQAEAILRQVPEAWLILRTGLYPPAAWFEEHPAEAIQFEDGTPVDTWFGKGTRIQCLGSRQWREDQTRELGRFVDWLPGQSFSARVIGFFLNAGGTGEWYIPTAMVQGGRCIDHSPAFRAQFRKTLEEAYGTEAALRTAWGREDATFAAPPIPMAADHGFQDVERALFAHYHGTNELPACPPPGAAIGSFCNPNTHRFVADFYRALNEGSADSIVHFARFLKDRTANTKVVGAFYGGFGYAGVGVATAVTRVLDSGVVDFLASPGDYTNRKPGGDTALHNMQDSYRIRKTIYVVEEDTRTVATAPSHDWGVNTLQESIEVMKRDFGRNLAEDLCAWWFDMSNDVNRHWYNFPRMIETMRRQQEVAEASYRGSRASPAEIAFLYDRESMHYAGNWTLTDIGSRTRAWELHRIGAPVACHYLDDLERPDMPAYKLLVFMNAFALDERRRVATRRYLEQRPCTALWLYAPGLIHPDRAPRCDVANVTALTGLAARSLPGPALPYCRLTPEGARMLPDVRPDWDYGWFTDRESSGTCEAWLQGQGLAQFSLLSPYLYGADPSAEVLMRFNTDGQPALVAADQPGGGRTVVAYFKALRAELYRSVARLAGCHIYAMGDDVLYVGRRFVTLHACCSGTKTLRFPAPCDPFEVYERKSYGSHVLELGFQMRMGETRTFHLQGPV